jgi:hypothetical protein
MKQSTLFDKSGMLALAYCSSCARVRRSDDRSAIKRGADFRDQFGQRPGSVETQNAAGQGG